MTSQTMHQCLNCKQGLLDHGTGSEEYRCPRCGAVYDRLTFLTAMNTGDIPPMKEKVNFIAAKASEQEERIMPKTKTGTCRKCKQEKELKYGKCEDCRTAAKAKAPGRPGRKPGKAYVKSAQVIDMIAKKTFAETERFSEPHAEINIHESTRQPTQIIPVKIVLDIEINVKVRIDKE